MLSEAGREVKFIYNVLISLNFSVTLPIIVNVDNLGTILMSENVSVSTRTKHVDIRYRFVQEFVLDGFLKIIFVRTKMNDADIFTNNLGGDLYYCHSRKMITEKGKKTKTTSIQHGRVLGDVDCYCNNGSKSKLLFGYLEYLAMDTWIFGDECWNN